MTISSFTSRNNFILCLRIVFLSVVTKYQLLLLRAWYKCFASSSPGTISRILRNKGSVLTVLTAGIFSNRLYIILCRNLARDGILEISCFVMWDVTSFNLPALCSSSSSASASCSFAAKSSFARPLTMQVSRYSPPSHVLLFVLIA